MGLLNSRSSSSSSSSRSGSKSSSSYRSSSSSSKKVSGVKLSISGSSSSRSPSSSSSSKKVTSSSAKSSSSSGILKGSSSYSPKPSGSSSGILKPVSGSSSSKTSSSYSGILKPPSSSSSAGSGILKTPAADKVSSGTLKPSGSSVLNLPSTANKVTGTLQNAWDVPRRDAIPGFSGIYTPDSPGLIKSYNGGKLGKDGIVRYPNGVNVDKAHAARSQAFFDVAYGDSTSGRSDMAALYGDDYTNEVRRLSNMKTGDLSWAELPASQRPAQSGTPSSRIPVDGGEFFPSGGGSFGGDLDSILSGMGSSGGNANGYDNGYLKDYLEAIEESKNASAEALRKQIEQGLAQLNSQKNSINDNFANAAQQNYINAMLNQRDLPQLMAAQGLNGGATESANLALMTNYQDNQNSLAQTHSQNLAQIAQEIADLYAAGNINLSNLEAAYGKETAKAILEAGRQAADLQSQKDMAVFKARIQAILSQANQQWQAQQDAANRQWQAQYNQDQANREYDLWLKKLQAQQA